MWRNKVNNISPLANLTKLESLQLTENRIVNIEPLTKNDGIVGTIHLTGNPLSIQSRDEYIPYLSSKGIRITW